MDKKSKKKTIVICGGHLTPALALYSEFSNIKDFKVIWIGNKYSQTDDKNLSAEYLTVKSLGIEFIAAT